MSMNTARRMLDSIGMMLDIFPWGESPAAKRVARTAEAIRRRSDADAIHGDWERVGHDLSRAFGRLTDGA